MSSAPLLDGSLTAAVARTTDGLQASPNGMQHANRERIAAAIREILIAIGEDPDRDGLVKTPARVARMYEELFAGLSGEPDEYLETTFEHAHDEMIVVRDIPFYSICEHHLLPCFGSAAVGYIPNERIVGISKLARVVEHLARRPQVQERLTCQVADRIEQVLDPVGVAVTIQAEHTCMTMRGVKKPGSRMVTSVTRGAFRNNPATRAEFFDAVQRR